MKVPQDISHQEERSRRDDQPTTAGRATRHVEGGGRVTGRAAQGAPSRRKSAKHLFRRHPPLFRWPDQDHLPGSREKQVGEGVDLLVPENSEEESAPLPGEEVVERFDKRPCR